MNSPTISALEGNHQSLDGGAMFGNAPRALWERWYKPDAQGRIRLSCRALLIESDGKRILCETGIGAFFEPKMRERFGVEEKEHVLLKSLQQLGLKDSDIDVVILSHLHFDHAGGLLPTYEDIAAGNNELLFPNAKYVVSETAFERCERPHSRDRASFIPGMADQLKQSGRLVIVSDNKTPSILGDRFSFWCSDGHTPGHMHTIFRGDQSTVVFAGDLIPGTPWVHLPVTMGYDRFPERLIDEKQDLYSRILKEDWRIFYTHDPEVPMSRLSQDSSGKFVPIDMIRDMKRLPL